jgi:uncharacterized membrane protein
MDDYGAPAGRTEALSDGVFTIAITPLVLEIGVPESSIQAALGHRRAKFGARLPLHE